MAVVGYKRVLDGTSISGKFGESLQIAERWLVRVDSPDTNKVDILNIVATAGVYWGAAHWEFPAHKAMEFSCSPTGKEGMLWTIEVKYYIPPPEKRPNPNGIPEDVWESLGGVTTIPAFKDRNDNMIVNAAKDPLEGLERERDERGWVLTKFYTDATWQTHRDQYAGSVNSAAWAGGAAKTWKADFKGATKRKIAKFKDGEEGGELVFVEARWEFRYEPQTWKCMPWDVGFMEIKSGKKQVILVEGKAVKQPVALNSDGSAKTTGSPPTVANNGNGFDLYPEQNFAGVFGTPSLI